MMSEDATSTTPAPALRRSVRTAAPVAALRAAGALQRVAQGARSLVPYGNYFAQRLGSAGVVGVALVVFSAMALVSANGPLRQQLTSDSAALAQVSSATGAVTAATAASPATQFDAFVQQLPTREDLPAIMGQVVAASTGRGVQLEQGKYELVATAKVGELARYRMSFPVVGSYPQVRGFVDDALAAVPSMSLDGLKMQRRDIGDGVVTANIDFAVFVRTGK